MIVSISLKRFGFFQKVFICLQTFTIVNRRFRGLRKTVATRIPSKLEQEIIQFMKEQGLDKSTAIRRILEIGVTEWKRKRAIELYRLGKVTLRKASQIAGISLREMLEELNRQRIAFHVTAQNLEEDIEAAKKAEA